MMGNTPTKLSMGGHCSCSFYSGFTICLPLKHKIACPFFPPHRLTCVCVLPQVQREFKSNCEELTVQKLITTFIEAKSTGKERPGMM